MKTYSDILIREWDQGWVVIAEIQQGILCGYRHSSMLRSRFKLVKAKFPSFPEKEAKSVCSASQKASGSSLPGNDNYGILEVSPKKSLFDSCFPIC
jgi:hypothetical protein